MHARKDNPELIRALVLNIPVYSFPEFMYEQTKNKLRVAVAGSHGKTTVTAMVLHVLKSLHRSFDYLVGSGIEGFDTMVGLSADSAVAVFEGDEYLSSPLDLRPKFYHYQPQILLLNGIAWDHMNVFPTWQDYINAFSNYLLQMKSSDILIYNAIDDEACKLAELASCNTKIGFTSVNARQENENSIVNYNAKDYKLGIFGAHNMSNTAAAFEICKLLSVQPHDFFSAMESFRGAARRLQLITENENKKVYLDFAHSPSKVKATIDAVKGQYSNKLVLACFELHTFSSLNSSFLKEYVHTMENADFAMVFFSEQVLMHKRMELLQIEQVKDAFASPNLLVIKDSQNLKELLLQKAHQVDIFLLMSSGNFGGLDVKVLANELLSQ
jgi:UDP-N-acetylmuramate: L-alanyl-gamma-D-glutamyl-meso-diaminopimelate ligase